MNDIFAVQDQIASDVAEELHVRLVGSTPLKRKTDPRTHALYLRAKFLFDRGLSTSSEQGKRLLAEALERDPDYIPALQLAARRAFMAGELDVAQATVERVLELDPNDGLSHVYRAWNELQTGRDLQAAVEMVETGLADAPGDPQVLELSGRLFRAIGLIDRAIDLLARSVALDPLCTRCLYQLAQAYLYAGDLEAAETRIRRYTRIAEGGWITLGNILLLQGDPEAALEAYARQRPPAGHEAWWLSSRAMALHELGRGSEFQRTLAHLIESWGRREPMAVARVYAWAGEADEAFDWLGRGPDRDSLAGKPFFKKVHGDPRWSELLEAEGLIPAPRADLDLGSDASSTRR